MPDEEPMASHDPLRMRRRLRHEVPAWVEEGARYFITVCCAQRGINQLCQDDVFAVWSGAIGHYVNAGRWWVDVALAMPDHWHALIAFPRFERMAAVVGDWKHYVARQAGVKWQEGFFDHRLRTNESGDEKWAYIAENPVRGGLCAKAEDWPWVWLAGGR
ncbi:MAG: hypothetical protein R3F03_13135 [Opitutaceae bacterium]